MRCRIRGNLILAAQKSRKVVCRIYPDFNFHVGLIIIRINPVKTIENKIFVFFKTVYAKVESVCVFTEIACGDYSAHTEFHYIPAFRYADAFAVGCRAEGCRRTAVYHKLNLLEFPEVLPGNISPLTVFRADLNLSPTHTVGSRRFHAFTVKRVRKFAKFCGFNVDNVRQIRKSVERI